MSGARGRRNESDAIDAAALIAKKRDGRELAAAEIVTLVQGFVAGRVPDYQMSAFAMAVYLRGMSAPEITALTLAMRDSGKRVDLSGISAPKIDKHSTGGVGDKVSICLAPLCAACGLAVPMIAGRGLGHTGGTLDKLEAIPGFRVDLGLARFQSLVARHGVALGGQTVELAPADRKLYALRDVTATVASIPLITASILSKKLCEDLDGLVLDVKVGRGAFMKSLEDARELGRSIARVGRLCGLTTRAVLTRMDSPLGRAVGNALETAEAIALLQGEAPDDLTECTLTLGAQMLRSGGLSRSRAQAEARLRAAVRDGSALRKLRQIVRAQGGDARVVDEPDRLPGAPIVSRIRAARSGYVAEVDALEVAGACLELGAGRSRAEDSVDHAVGVVLRKKPGDRVRQGEILAELHLRSRAQRGPAAHALHSAFRIERRRPTMPPLVIETL